MNIIKKTGYSLVGLTATLLPTMALAIPPATKPVVKAAAVPGAQGKIMAVAQGILTTANVNMLGGILAAIGLIIIIWKVSQMVFGQAEWVDEAKMVLGGLLIMIIGTNFHAVVTLLLPSNWSWTP